MTAQPPDQVRRPRVGIACHPRVRSEYLGQDDLTRLVSVADVRVADFFGPWAVADPTPPNPEAESALADFASDLDVLVVCHGAPRVTERVFAAAPDLRMVGELEGDRFAGRIDV